MALHFPINRASVNMDYYVCDAKVIRLKQSPKKLIFFRGMTHEKMRMRIKRGRNIKEISLKARS